MKLQYTLTIGLLLCGFLSFAQNTITINGRITDSKTSAPIPFATVWVTGSNNTVVSNGDGDFILKIPSTTDSLWVKHLGYAPYAVSVKEAQKHKQLIVKLLEAPLSLESVVVRSNDPVILLRAALRNVENNYPHQPLNLVGFYRETIRKNNQYVSVVEAIPDIYKAPMPMLWGDQVKIYKGRRSYDFSRVDTLLMKYQGGLNTALMLDVAKFQESIFIHPDSLNHYYDLAMGPNTQIQGREQLVIYFTQKEKTGMILFRGKIYLDYEKLAISRCEYAMNVEGVDEAARLFVVKQPPRYDIKMLEATFVMDYLYDHNLWQYNYSKAVLVVSVRSDKRKFNADYTITSELAVTDRTAEQVSKFPTKERLKSTELVFDRVIDYSDPEFWEQYNFIEPEQSLESAVRRLNRRIHVKR